MPDRSHPTSDEARRLLYDAVGCLPHFFMGTTRVAVEQDLLTDETEPIHGLEMYAYLNRLRKPKLPPLSGLDQEAK